ncbi:MAG: heavy metal translocating P-type ATPase [Vicinamibacteraceae bacterium]
MARAAECAVCVEHTESTFKVEGLCCQHEAELLARRLGTLRGVERTSTDVVRQRLRVAYDAAVTSRGAIAEAVAETGLRAFPDDEPRDVPAAPAGSRVSWLAISATALAAGLAAVAVGAPRPWSVGLLALAVVSGGATTLRRAVVSARQGRLDMFVLMTVAVAGAALIGEWIEAATVVVLFALAQALERRSLDRARHAIRTLVADAPADVARRRGGQIERVPIAAVAVGDVLIVGPGERIALDGDVVAGASDVNQAPITGESLPVSRAAGDRVFAGTVNGTGALDIRVTAIGDDTTLARIIHLVERAQATRAPSQAWVDRFAARYTPAVLVLAALVAIVPPLAFGEDVGVALYRALVLLVIACPCALVLSTPISIVSALAAAARRGVLIKGGLHLERLAAITAVAVDKTGTLTHGVLGVVDVVALDDQDADADTVLATAAAVAARSPHPVDRAIAAHARHARGVAPVALMPAADVQAMPGLGIAGDVAGVRVELGSPRHFAARGWLSAPLAARADAATARGLQVVLVARDGQAIGLVSLGDELKTHARDAIAELRASGVRHVAMLSGDHAPAADAAGQASGVDTVAAGLLPDQKVGLVRDLTARFGPVAMIGDGVNDAPALAAAHVGIAMGAAGTAAAIETADVALMSDDLRGAALAIRLGRATLSTIRVNVAAALAIKVVTVVLAVAGVATLWMAVLADVGGSLIVVANALRLLRTK